MRYTCLAPLVLAVPVAGPALGNPPDEALETVVVSAQQQGYDAAPSDTFLRGMARPLDLPQTVTVLSEQLLRDRAPASLAEALRAVPGVGINQGEGNRDSLILRGVATTADFLVDGLRDDLQYFRDFYNVQQIEVLTGPNGLLSGHGGGGGVVNRVTRQAGGDVRDLSLTRSSQDGWRVTADWGQRWTAQSAGRLNLLWEDSDSFRDDVHLQRKGLAPALRLELTPAVTLSAGGEHFTDERVADRGVPSLAGRPLATPPGQFFGDPARSNSEVQVDALWSGLQWQVSQGMSLRNRNRWASYDKVYSNVYARGLEATTLQVQLSAYTQATRRQSFINQTELQVSSQWLGLKHELVAGLEWGLQRNDNRRLTGYFTDRSPTTTVVAVPVSKGRVDETVTWRAAASDADSLSHLQFGSAYLQDQVTVNRYLQLQLGVRGEAVAARLTNRRSNSSIDNDETLWSPRAALIVQPLPSLSLYASYGSSRQTRAGEQLASLTDATAGLAPESLSSREAGIKWAISPAGLMTLAAYELTRRDVAVTDPSDATRQVLTDGQRVRGLETAASYASDLWQVQGSIAWQRAWLMSDQSSALLAGSRLAAVPALTASLWSRWQLSPAWGVGLGVQHRGEVLAATQNLAAPATDVWLPAFQRLDAALYWSATAQWRVQLNVENLLDRGYFAAATNNFNILPGAPRYWRLGISGHF